MQAMSVSVDGAAALLDSSSDVTAALVHTLQQSASEPSQPAANAAMQCLANLTRTQVGVKASVRAELAPAVTAIVQQVLPPCITPQMNTCIFPWVSRVVLGVACMLTLLLCWLPH